MSKTVQRRMRALPGDRGPLVSMTVQPAGDRPEKPRALTREEYLARGRPLPPLEDTVIEDLTDEEAEAFWECISNL